MFNEMVIMSTFWLWAYLMKVISVAYLMKVISETYLMKVISETCLVH